MFATILLIASTCTPADDCQFYQLDSWREAEGVHECTQQKNLRKDPNLGCYVLSGESDKSFWLESIEPNGKEFIEIFK